MKPKAVSTLPWSMAWKGKFIHPDEAEAKVSSIRSEGCTIATLNGSFDLLHAGHLHIIYEASKTADKLIVALNSDDSIRKYKSPQRPIVPLEYRLQLIAALEWVDYVTCFHETDPRVLLEKIKPDIHVNGIEYSNNCIEADTVANNGGKLHLVDRLPGLATSHILTKILEIHHAESTA